MNTIAKISLLVLITFCLTAGASAATFVVNTTADTLDTNLGNGVCEDAGNQCSLRAAISEANALAGPDIITLSATTYTLSIPNDGVNETNLNGDLDVTSELTINGVSEVTTIIQAAATRLSATDRVLDVRPSGNLMLTNMTIRHGRPVSGVPPHGGGIHNGGSLDLSHVTVTDNETGGGEGAGGGGGIGSEGPVLTLNSVTVTGNFVNNGGGTAYGGGLSSFTTPPDTRAAITINDSTISGNFTHGLNDMGSGAFLNGVYNLNALNSHFDDNTSSANTASTGTGLQALNFASGLTTLSIVDCTFNGNTGSTGSYGATGVGIQVTTSTSSSASINMTLDGVTVDGNTGTNVNIDGGTGIKVLGGGGAIVLDVRNSTISNNSGAPFGGGIFLTSFVNGGGGSSSNVDAFIRNSTFSGNSAGVGGALATQVGSHSVLARLDSVTVTNNSATSSAGGLSNFGAGGIYLTGSIVAGNTAPNGPDISAVILSFDYNHIGNPQGAFFNGTTAHHTTGDAMLGTLANNGGPTLTYLPGAASPVVDSIPIGQAGCGVAGGAVGDQRGFGRPFGSGCDRGAVERGASLAAGPWTLSGVIKTTTEQPIRNAAVTISGGNLPAPVTVFTGNFGTYQFTNLTGNEYTVSVSIKRYHFNDSTQVFSLGSSITNADFIANAPFGREVLGLGQVKGKVIK